MFKKIFFILCGLPAYGIPAEAETCNDFKSCAKVMFEVTQERYVWGGQNISISAATDIDITKENAALVFTALLDQAGFARVPVGDGKTYHIVSVSQRREMETPIIEASAEQKPDLPETWDWVTLRYKVRSPETAKYLENNYRLSVPREARLIADENTGTVELTATVPVARKMYATLKGGDKPLTPSFRAKLLREEEGRRKAEK